MTFFQFTSFWVPCISKTEVRITKVNPTQNLTKKKVKCLKQKVKIDKFFIILTMKITCCMGLWTEKELHFTCFVKTTNQRNKCDRVYLNFMKWMTFKEDPMKQEISCFPYISCHKLIHTTHVRLPYSIQSAYFSVDDMDVWMNYLSIAYHRKASVLENLL